MVLAVGDSYYWNIYNTRIPAELFANDAFWYFGKLVYPEHYSRPSFVDDLNLQEEIEKQDVILLMATERFLYKFDWTLVNRLYSLYGKSSRFDRVYDYTGQITNNDEWFNLVINKAGLRNLSLDSMLYGDARYTYSQSEPENYAVFYGVGEQEERIRGDAAWMRDISEKAARKGSSIEEMIRLDAGYVLSNENPEAVRKYKEIHDRMTLIRQDSSLLEEIRKEAAYYYLDFEEMLYIRAEEMAFGTEAGNQVP